MKWIALGTLTGWAGIVWLAWALADSRVAICYFGDERCKITATAARDAVLIGGLTVALVGLAVAGCVALVRSGRLNLRSRSGSSTIQAASLKRLP